MNFFNSLKNLDENKTVLYPNEFFIWKNFYSNMNFAFERARKEEKSSIFLVRLMKYEREIPEVPTNERS